MNNADDDNPLWTKEDFATARPAREMLPPHIADQLVGLGERQRITQALNAEGVLLVRQRFQPHSLRAAA